MTSQWLRIAGFAAVFFLINTLTIGFSRYGGGLALVWFGSAIGAVMLIGLPREYWGRGLATLALASALSTALVGFGPHMAAPFAFINTIEAWLIAWLLLTLRPERDWLDSVAGLAVLVVVGVVAAGLVAILGGWAASHAASGSYAFHAGSWWAAHGLGAVIGFPMAYLLTTRSNAEAGGRRTARNGAGLAAHMAAIGLVTLAATDLALVPILFIPIVPLLLAAFRCGREGATLGLLVIAGTVSVTLGHDAIHIGGLDLTPGQKVLFIQLYLATLSILALPVSVALRQHQLVLVELQERRALKELIAEHTDDALLNLDGRGAIRYASAAAARLSGIDELVGLPLAAFFDPLDDQLVRGALAQAAAVPGETVDMERAVIRGEEQLWLEAKIRAVALAAGSGGKPGEIHGYAVTIRDVTARKQTELDAIQAAETDPLTGLANRRALLGQLERGLAHAEHRPFALAILDLDHFKVVNDTHGHIAGDQVLLEVAGVMRRMTSPSRFFARLGGEEFAIVSRQPSFESSLALCEQLREAIAALRFTAPDGARFQVTASIGCTRIASGGTAAQALQAADALLYHAKHAGRNRVEAMPWNGERRAIRRAA